MKISILNDVLGPVMRGPSSSHTAGSYHISRLARDLFGEKPVRAEFIFDASGSYGQTYDKQNADRGFVSGLLQLSLIDEGFDRILKTAEEAGMQVNFSIDDLPEADHPNFVEIHLSNNRGESSIIQAKSTGGGSCKLSSWNGWNINLDGGDYGCLLFISSGFQFNEDSETYLGRKFSSFEILSKDSEKLMIIRSDDPLNKKDIEKIPGDLNIKEIRFWDALNPVKRGKGRFDSLTEMQIYLDKTAQTLGEGAMRNECDLLEISEEGVIREMKRRLEIMKDTVDRGFNDKKCKMKLLNPTASRINQAINDKKVSVGGPHARAGAQAIAAMHACNSGAVVCAAPTGGAAGVIPGVMVTLINHLKLDDDSLVKALFAAGAVGWAVARQATFAAETAGCQVEIGAAGAMAAAAVVEAVGGTPRQALDAAAIALQNTMGSVCDLVQGICEIPCHTRNAAAASNAFLCADLILGGYENPIPLDETIDAVFESGKMLPAELRCTARGGLAVTPSALQMKPKGDCSC